MAGVLPSNISFFMQRLQGVSSSHFKITPQSSDSATSNKIIRFELPSNTLINFRNVRLFFNAATAGTTAGGRLPNKIDSLIERVAVYMGGVLVQNNFNKYNVLRHAKDAIMGDKCSSMMGHPEIVREVSYHDSSTYITDGNEGYTHLDDQFCIDYFEGLMGSLEPSIVDSGLLPAITLEITLAEDAVCPSVDGVIMAVGDGTGATNTIDKENTNACTYTLTNLNLQVEVLGLATSVLDSLVESRISSVGYLSLPFKNYYTYSSSHSGTTRFSANSASLDRIWFAYRPTTFATTPAGVHVPKGYKVQGGLVVESLKKALVNNGSGISASTTVAIDTFSGGTIKVGDLIQIPQATAGVITTRITALGTPSGTSATNTLTTADAISCADNSPILFVKDVGLTRFDSGGVLDTNKEKYISKYFRFKDPTNAPGTTPSKFSLQVNGASLPAYKMNRSEFYEITKMSAETYKTEKEMSFEQYTDSYFVQCMRFNLEGSDMTRLASGLDTRAVSAQMALETEGLDPTHLDIFVETTAELRVGSGRSIEIIA